jgi:TetR/AcrR family transcriptional regulator
VTKESKVSKGRRPKSEAESSRRQIVATARRLFASHGFDAVGVRDIAEQAGTTHGLVRHHFGSKLGVWQAVVDAAEDEYSSALGPLLDNFGQKDVFEEAAFFIRSLAETTAQHADLTRLIMHEGTAGGPRLSYILAHLTSAHQRLGPLLGSLQARGALTQFTSKTLFHFLLFSLSAPFALPALSEGLIGKTLLAAHADLLVRTLLGPMDKISEVFG